MRGVRLPDPAFGGGGPQTGWKLIRTSEVPIMLAPNNWQSDVQLITVNPNGGYGLIVYGVAGSEAGGFINIASSPYKATFWDGVLISNNGYSGGPGATPINVLRDTIPFQAAHYSIFPAATPQICTYAPEIPGIQNTMPIRFAGKNQTVLCFEGVPDNGRVSMIDKQGNYQEAIVWQGFGGLGNVVAYPGDENRWLQYGSITTFNLKTTPQSGIGGTSEGVEFDDPGIGPYLINDLNLDISAIGIGPTGWTIIYAWKLIMHIDPDCQHYDFYHLIPTDVLSEQVLMRAVDWTDDTPRVFIGADGMVLVESDWDQTSGSAAISIVNIPPVPPVYSQTIGCWPCHPTAQGTR